MNITPEIYKLINDLVEDKIKELKIQREEFESLKAAVDRLTESHERALERLSKLETTVEELVKVQERVLERLDKVEERLDRLEDIVEELAKAQKRSEERIDRLEKAVAELAKAQRRTEERVDKLEKIVEELALAQKKAEERLSKVEERLDKVEERLDRLEKVVEELAKAQKRSEERIDSLEKAVEELAEAQKRLEAAIEKLTGKMEEFERHLMALGARWGFLSEESFRNAMRDLLSDVGYIVENVAFEDEEGYVFGDRSTVEIDVVIRDGKKIAVEIKSSVSKADVGVFKKKVELYERLFKRKVDELMIVSPFVHPKAMTLAAKLGIKVATSKRDLE